ncbi:MAG: MFS transporter [Kordiimonas sp.]|nr:MFS transporter [Kordiimonas sp.]|tara:strand:+ start:1297 stop:2553 length:1257 start_codon:yes stop_codon:yes gene_type:complete
MSDTNVKWDHAYEWKAVMLLSLGFGLVGLDRWIIAPLLPSMMADLNLNYQDVGLVFGALGMAWGIFAILSGRLSDRIGHRKVLIPAIVFFSLMSGVSGMVHGLVGLILVRSLMGISEGAFCPTSFAATAAAAKPSRRGILQGLQQSGFALFGLALGPIIATQLLLVVPSWREVFWVVALPGFVIGLAMYFVLRDPEHTQGMENLAATKGEEARWADVIRERNVILCMLGLFCVMSCVFVLSAMVPLYLENYLKLSPQDMGFIMSAIGFGGFAGQFGVPAASDWLGRKIVSIVSFVFAAIFVWFFAQTGVDMVMLFTTLFILSFFSFGNIALLSGPVATEAAPPGLVATSIGLVVGAGEIFGGGIAPVISGAIAEKYGIESVLYFALIGVTLGALVSLFLKETAPRKISAAAASAPTAE